MAKKSRAVRKKDQEIHVGVRAVDAELTPENLKLRKTFLALIDAGWGEPVYSRYGHVSGLSTALKYWRRSGAGKV